MDGNFNNEQNDFVTEEYTDNTNAKQFDEVAPDHLPENQGKAKLSFEFGLIGLLCSIACIFVYFVLNRMMYIMILLPIMPVAGIVSGIVALKSDRGLPKAYIGIVLSVLSILPTLLCVFLFLYEVLLYRFF
ncbi:hypothetical protein SAMN04487760_10591 [Lachnospiraceae bacterium G41]|nr:hypothetical protein SAMN04487760_10591 [Lachnospiraceae bacterium G41]